MSTTEVEHLKLISYCRVVLLSFTLFFHFQPPLVFHLLNYFCFDRSLWFLLTNSYEDFILFSPSISSLFQPFYTTYQDRIWCRQKKSMCETKTKFRYREAGGKGRKNEIKYRQINVFKETNLGRYNFIEWILILQLCSSLFILSIHWSNIKARCTRRIGSLHMRVICKKDKHKSY